MPLLSLCLTIYHSDPARKHSCRFACQLSSHLTCTLIGKRLHIDTKCLLTKCLTKWCSHWKKHKVERRGFFLDCTCATCSCLRGLPPHNSAPQKACTLFAWETCGCMWRIAGCFCWGISFVPWHYMTKSHKINTVKCRFTCSHSFCFKDITNLISSIKLIQISSIFNQQMNAVISSRVLVH